MDALGWKDLEIILVTGDAYIDSPFIGVAVIGQVLLNAGFRVGIIAQPDTGSADDISRLGEPTLFWGITGGCIDSLVANRTAAGKKRKQDDYTPGGLNTRRPDRAVLAYANLIRRFHKNTVPLVLGGLEASLRRIAHYDYWSNKIRRSILFDAKADYILYGMADRSVVELARCLRSGGDPAAISGLCFLTATPPEEAIPLPSFEQVSRDKEFFTTMFQEFYENNDPLTASQLSQQHGNRYLVQNPPQPYLSTRELDRVYGLDYQRDLHPYYKKAGTVRALDTIRFAIATHRGCYGECNFCAIAVHQGRTVRSRSQNSILAEAKAIAAHPDFKGTIADVGGPTANMYGFECKKKHSTGCCQDKRCLFPSQCRTLHINHGPLINLLKKLRAVKGVKKVVVASGIRYDLILEDRKHGLDYLRQVIRHHVSGQMKIAPEHCDDNVLACMGKPGRDSLLRFRELFNRLTREEGLQQFLTYYIIAAHPGCAQKDMQDLKNFARKQLKLIPRQVQIFTPTPSTWSTLMYWTERNPFTGKPCFVEKSFQGRERQKQILTGNGSGKQRPGKSRPGHAGRKFR